MLFSSIAARSSIDEMLALAPVRTGLGRNDSLRGHEYLVFRAVETQPRYIQAKVAISPFTPAIRQLLKRL
jgi:hypothetical protein